MLAVAATLCPAGTPPQTVATAPAPSRDDGGVVATTTLTASGVLIDCGPMGRFLLSHPWLILESEARAKPLEATVSGNAASLRYSDGGELRATLTSGAVRYEFVNRPAGCKGAYCEMRIPLRFAGEGSWAIDGVGGAFPTEKPPRGVIAMRHGREFSIDDVSGARLSLRFPRTAFLIVQDNREWGWNIFQFSANLADASASPWEIGFALDTSNVRATHIVDRFGQMLRDFPGKVASEDELRADAESEDTYYASLDFAGRFGPVRNALRQQADNSNNPLDRFGGVAGLGQDLGLRATGFFHVERRDADGRERWLLVDPDGNPFFHLGVCCLGPGDSFTDVSGRESQFEWLPPHDGPFAAAWKDKPGDPWNARAASFYVANIVRKFGEWSSDAHYARLVRRIRTIGFNSIGAFYLNKRAARADFIPYVATVSYGGVPRLKGVRDVFDPYDPESAECLEKAMAAQVDEARDDPLLIGYFIGNEQGFEDIPRAVPAATGTAAKRALVDFLLTRHRTTEAVASAWALTSDAAASPETLLSTPLSVSTKAAFADASDFTAELLERYYAMIEETFRRHDPNHLLIGSRWQPGTANNEALCRAAGRHLDIVSVNYYASAIDRAFIRRIHDWTGGKPQFWSEFFYTAARESNCGPLGHDLATQRERGLAYRNYVETAASLGFVVGIEWFSLIDQAATGRFFEGVNGERHNNGLFNVLDRPYRDLLDGMLAAHLHLYPVWLGGEQPFKFDDPRFNPSAALAVRSCAAGRATAPVMADGRQDGYPVRPPERIPSSRLVLGRDAGGLEASFKATWDDEALHVLVSVTDPTPMCNAKSGQRLWDGDCVELFLGAEDPDRHGPMLFTDRQILLGAAASGSFHAVNAPEQPAIRTAVVPAAGGYVLEASIPWTTLPGYAPKEGDTLLFNIAIDDAAPGSGRRAQLAWNGTERNSSDRSAWGRLVLVP